MQSPKDIYQEMLDVTTKAFWAGDFDLGCSRLAFPGFVRTRDALLTYETKQEFIPSIRSMIVSMVDQGATAYLRVCDMADYVADTPDRIRGTHTTYVLRGGTYIIPPYSSRMELVQEGGLWKGSGIYTDVKNSVCSIIHSEPSGRAPSSDARKDPDTGS